MRNHFWEMSLLPLSTAWWLQQNTPADRHLQSWCPGSMPVSTWAPCGSVIAGHWRWWKSRVFSWVHCHLVAVLGPWCPFASGGGFPWVGGLLSVPLWRLRAAWGGFSSWPYAGSPWSGCSTAPGVCYLKFPVALWEPWCLGSLPSWPWVNIGEYFIYSLTLSSVWCGLWTGQDEEKKNNTHTLKKAKGSIVPSTRSPQCLTTNSHF